MIAPDIQGDAVAEVGVIGGFSNEGAIPIKVLVRAIGPSLGTTGVLANPVFELHEPDGTVITNDDWMTGPGPESGHHGDDHPTAQRARVGDRDYAPGR
jgi:hypothetical protein